MWRGIQMVLISKRVSVSFPGDGQPFSPDVANLRLRLRAPLVPVIALRVEISIESTSVSDGTTIPPGRGRDVP